MADRGRRSSIGWNFLGDIGPRRLLDLAVLLALLSGCQKNSTPTPDDAAKAPAAHATDSASTKSSADESPSAISEFLKDGNEKKPAGAAPIFVQLKELVSQYPDGRPSMRRTVRIMSDDSTLNHGPYVEWYPSGEKYMQGNYVEGVRQGAFTSWHENGKICKTQTYADGKLEGSWPIFRDDGTKEKEVGFHADQRSGVWKYYDATGKQLTAQEEYKDGKANGVWTLWRAEGKPLKEQHFTNGEVDGQLTEWFDNGRKAHVKTFKKGRVEGTEIYWKPTGEKLREVSWSNGQLITLGNPGTDPAVSTDNSASKR